MPNPWDVGSAVALAGMGFAALATTSAGHAWALGRGDGQVPRDEELRHLRELAGAVEIPLNADFQGGFADDPADVAANVKLAAETGIAGLSIEDSTGDADEPLYDLGLAVERIRAARSAIDESGTGVLLTGRSEGFLVGRPDLDETIRRLQAYAEAGADCLYAPFISTPEQISAVVAAVAPKPVNLLIYGAVHHGRGSRVPRRAADQRRRRPRACGFRRRACGRGGDRHRGHVFAAGRAAEHERRLRRMSTRIAIAVFAGAEELDFVGPWEVLAAWRDHGPADVDVEVVLVGESTEPVTCAKGLRVIPHTSWEDLGDIDVLVYPGGRGTRTQLGVETIRARLRGLRERGTLLTSVCTGSLVYADAGLLDGRPATTYWRRSRSFCDSGTTSTQSPTRASSTTARSSRPPECRPGSTWPSTSSGASAHPSKPGTSAATSSTTRSPRTRRA